MNMELETEVLNEDLASALDGFEEGDLNLSVRSKTSLRMNYEAQVEVLKKQLGTLENIRLELGLSQRKMAQLLLVDPSSWTRWMKSGDAPPHIWRALQWYLALKEKIPGLTNQYFLTQSSETQTQKALSKLREEFEAEMQNQQDLELKIADFSMEKRRFEQELGSLKKELNFQRKMSIVITLISISGLALILFWKGL